LDYIFNLRHEQKKENNWQTVILPAGLDVSEIVITITLSLFIFKMQSIRNKMQSETPKLYRLKEAKNRIYRYIVWVFLIAYGIAIVVLDVLYPGAGNDITKPGHDHDD